MAPAIGAAGLFAQPEGVVGGPVGVGGEGVALDGDAREGVGVGVAVEASDDAREAGLDVLGAVVEPGGIAGVGGQADEHLWWVRRAAGGFEDVLGFLLDSELVELGGKHTRVVEHDDHLVYERGDGGVVVGGPPGAGFVVGVEPFGDVGVGRPLFGGDGEDGAG